MMDNNYLLGLCVVLGLSNCYIFGLILGIIGERWKLKVGWKLW